MAGITGITDLYNDIKAITQVEKDKETMLQKANDKFAEIFKRIDESQWFANEPRVWYARSIIIAWRFTFLYNKMNVEPLDYTGFKPQYIQACEQITDPKRRRFYYTMIKNEARHDDSKGQYKRHPYKSRQCKY